MEDYDYITGDTRDDLDYYDHYEVEDEVLYYDPHDYYDETDVIEDDYYDERDDVMNEDFDVWEGDGIPEVENVFDQSQHGSDENMSEASDGENAGEDFDGSGVDVHQSGDESYEDENEESLDQGSIALEDAVCGVLEDDDGENVGDDHSDLSCGSELDVYADAQNGNYGDDGPEYIHSDYEEMDDEYDDDDPWEHGMMDGVPWQMDDMWDDAAPVGEEWDEYYDGGDEVWDEEADGRFEVGFEDYAGEDVPLGVTQGKTQNSSVGGEDSATPKATAGGGLCNSAAASGDVQDSEVASGVCPICLDQLAGHEVGNPWNCKHYFCIGCILEWVRRRNTCPVDREVIDKIAVRCSVGGAVTRVATMMPAGLARGGGEA